VSVAKAFKGGSLATMVADMPVQDEGLFAVSQALVVVPEQDVNPARVVQGLCLASAITGGT